MHPDPLELGRVFTPAVAVVSGAAQFLARDRAPRRRALGGAHRAGARRLPGVERAAAGAAALDLGAVVAALAQRLGGEAIIAADAGNFSFWVGRHLRHDYRSQVMPESGAMGYGLPAALAAKLRHPDRQQYETSTSTLTNTYC